MKNDDHVKENVRSVLQDMNFQTQLIPESYDKTPDLRVVMPEGDMIVEVRAREDDEQLRRLSESPLGTPFSYTSCAIECYLHKKWTQIHEFPGRKDEDFTLIWYVTRFLGGMTIFTASVAESLLYGTESLEGETVDQKEYYKTCFAFQEPFFFKYKNLDGVVLHEPESIKLCLNPYSYGYSIFKNTRFTDVFRSRFTVVDPTEMEASGECFIADGSAGWTDTNAVVRYLKSRYGLDTVKILIPILFNYNLGASR